MKLSEKLKRLLLSGLVMGYIFLFAALWQLPDGKFHIWFLDVGQGDSILIETPGDNHILIDGGPGPDVLSELSAILPFFEKEIDLLVLSHPHADHINGVIEVLKRYSVKAILFSGVNFAGGAYDEFLREIRAQQIDFWIAEASDDFRFGPVILNVIYPREQAAGEEFANLNNSSVAIKVIYDDVKILLTGDLETEAEAALVNSGEDLRAEILKAGHHGSKTASSIEFLKKVKPKVVVIQSGEGNSFGHPHDESLNNFEKIGVEKVYRNDLDGRVEFVF